MSLGRKQEKFSRELAALIHQATEHLGLEVRTGEVYRDPEWQLTMVRRGLSRTTRSRHNQKLAVDIILVKDGEVTWDPEDYRELGEWWMGRSADHVWGGMFGATWSGNRIVKIGWDAGHFELAP